MVSKIILAGRPGSGKSAAARYIQVVAEQRQWRTSHINDYKFLKQMYEMEGTGKAFQASAHDGFDVLDLSVLDTALHMVEKEVLAYCPCRRELALVEFARNNYHTALRLFSHAFLHDAYLLFFHVDINTCARRVQMRSHAPETVDDHFISEEMLWSYYHDDMDAEDIARLVHELDLDPSRVRLITNMGSWREFHQQLREVVETFLDIHERALLPHTCAYRLQGDKQASSLLMNCAGLQAQIAQPFDRM
ncbi:MAG TPA: hypothetical protein VL485_17170 [Ktedonobacteraceae bacterium]|jgi:hypothetical protein|nr:hypothetical protein [Ktedonobacteraceae bacterium]